MEVRVSIHALVKSATDNALDGRHFPRVSIHALVKSATGSCSTAMLYYKGFNPRTREECDATTCRLDNQDHGFNPRTREECDPQLIVTDSSSPAFQSTHS